MKMLDFDILHPELTFGLIALFSINVSEAGVERSFSFQKLSHSKLRNRMKDKTVQEEMTIRFNQGQLLVKVAKTTDAPLELGLVSQEENGVEIEGFDPNVIEEISSLPSFDSNPENEHDALSTTITTQLSTQ